MKNLFIAAAIVLGTVAFSACGGEKKETETTTETTETTTETTVDTMSTDTAATMSTDTAAH